MASSLRRCFKWVVLGLAGIFFAPIARGEELPVVWVQQEGYESRISPSTGQLETVDGSVYIGMSSSTRKILNFDVQVQMVDKEGKVVADSIRHGWGVDYYAVSPDPADPAFTTAADNHTTTVTPTYEPGEGVIISYCYLTIKVLDDTWVQGDHFVRVKVTGYHFDDIMTGAENIPVDLNVPPRVPYGDVLIHDNDWEFDTGEYVRSSAAVVRNRPAPVAPPKVQSEPALDDYTVYIGSTNGKVYALKGSDGTKIWEFTTGGFVIGAPAVGRDGTVYVGSYDKKLYALDPATGGEKWSYETGGVIFSSPAIGPDGTVYVGSYDDKLYALDPQATDPGKRLKWAAAFPTGYEVRSSPAIGKDGTVYFGSQDKKVYAVAPNGVKKWEYVTGGNVYSSPAIGMVGADEVLFIGSHDGNLYALNADGTERWRYAAGQPIVSSPAISASGVVYVGCDDGKLHAINIATGAGVWTYTTGSGVQSSPAIRRDGRILFGSWDSKLYELTTAGARTRHFDDISVPDVPGIDYNPFEAVMDGPVDSSPVVCPDSRIIIGSGNGKVYGIIGGTGANHFEPAGTIAHPWSAFRQNPCRTGKMLGVSVVGGTLAQEQGGKATESGPVPGYFYFNLDTIPDFEIAVNYRFQSRPAAGDYVLGREPGNPNGLFVLPTVAEQSQDYLPFIALTAKAPEAGHQDATAVTADPDYWAGTVYVPASYIRYRMEAMILDDVQPEVDQRIPMDLQAAVGPKYQLYTSSPPISDNLIIVSDDDLDPIVDSVTVTETGAWDTRDLTVRAHDPDDFPLPAALTCTWTMLSGPVGAAVTFTNNGTQMLGSAGGIKQHDSTATFTAKGPYVLRATVSDGMATVFWDEEVYITDVVTGLVIINDPARLWTGESANFEAIYVKDGRLAMGDVTSWTWSYSTAPTGYPAATLTTAPDQFCVFTAPATLVPQPVTPYASPVDYILTCTANLAVGGPVTANRAVTVDNRPPDALPAPSMVQFPTRVRLQVIGSDPDNVETDLKYEWETNVTDPVVTYVKDDGTPAVFPSNEAKTTNAVLTLAGTYRFRAKVTDPCGAFVYSEFVTVVVEQELGLAFSDVLTVVPTTPSPIYTGETLQFSVVAKDQFGNPMLTPPAVGWTVTPPDSGASISSAGLFSAPARLTIAQGASYTYRVDAITPWVRAAAFITVNNRPPRITSATATPTADGRGFVLQAVAEDSDSDPATDLQYTWSIVAPAVVSQQPYPGNASWPAIRQDLSCSFFKDLNGDGDYLDTDEDRSPRTLGYAVVNNEYDLTYSFNITVTDPNGATDQQVITYRVRQVLNGQLGITPLNRLIGPDETRQLSATLVTALDQFGGAYQNPPSVPVTWSLSPATGRGSISATGLYTAPASTGDVTVTAAPASAGVQVTAATQRLITVQARAMRSSPSDNTNWDFFLDDGTERFGTYLQSLPINDASYAWTITPPPIMLAVTGRLLNATLVPGPYQAQVVVQQGSDSITSSLQLSVNDFGQLLTSIVITPNRYTLRYGGAMTFTAEARDQGGNPMAIQPDFVWAVNGGGTIYGSGPVIRFRANRRQYGTFEVTASSGGTIGRAYVKIKKKRNWLQRLFGM